MKKRRALAVTFHVQRSLYQKHMLPMHLATWQNPKNLRSQNWREGTRSANTTKAKRGRSQRFNHPFPIWSGLHFRLLLDYHLPHLMNLSRLYPTSGRNCSRIYNKRTENIPESCSHACPVNPGGHIHEKESPWSTDSHVPLFWQGSDTHGGSVKIRQLLIVGVFLYFYCEVWWEVGGLSIGSSSL